MGRWSHHSPHSVACLKGVVQLGRLSAPWKHRQPEGRGERSALGAVLQNWLREQERGHSGWPEAGRRPGAFCSDLWFPVWKCLDRRNYPLILSMLSAL